MTNILILCTGNSARSILAEAIVNRLGEGRFVGYSAGSTPKGEVHPQALALLRRLGHPTDNLRSKSWDAFAAADGPRFDFIITVCDNAANEACPVWPGRPTSSHWGMPDPAAAEGSDEDVARAFAETYRLLSHRIGLFVRLPFESLSPPALKAAMAEIGAASPPVPA
jgi:protein-tyrosine-phosphatase